MKRRLLLLIILLLADVTVWTAVSAYDNDGVLKVTFLDVGQGDAVLIQAYNGNQLLIDGGKAGTLLPVLAEALPFFDRSIDVVLATHPDADHIGGLPALLRRYRVSAFADPGAKSGKALESELEEAVRAEGAKRLLARRGLRVWLANDVVFEIHYPDRDPSGLETNEASVIGKLIYGETSFLLTGDAPTRAEEQIVWQDGERLDVDVLKVGHHGSKTSTSEDLLKVATPAYAVISVGSKNTYGHPTPLVLGRLAAAGATILRTDQMGSIVMESDGKQVTLVK
jgi:competence protein ComEC